MPDQPAAPEYMLVLADGREIIRRYTSDKLAKRAAANKSQQARGDVSLYRMDRDTTPFHIAHYGRRI